MSRLPASLDELETAFVPISPWEKRHIGSRNAEGLYAPGDDVLEAYLDAGHNYSVVTRGDLAVFDVDEPERLADAVNKLPPPAWWMTGSRKGEAYILYREATVTALEHLEGAEAEP